MNDWQLEVQRLKRNIEDTRERLNILIDQNVPSKTDEIMDTSQKLDVLIKDYYLIIKAKV